MKVAASLVNELATERANGRRVPAPSSSEDLRIRAERALRAADALRAPPDPDQARGLAELAATLRLIFIALHERRDDDAAALLGELLESSGAAPHLHRRGSEPWRLHFHPPDAELVRAWAAGCAVGLAFVLSGGHRERLGICAAPACERVYVDLSRNGSRKFCSTACQNRVKAAHYRARRRQASRADS